MAPRIRTERLAWPDLARGACMVLAVLLHVDHALRHVDQNDEYLHLLNELLVPLRQPLFFLISGVLGGGILSRQAPGVLVHRVGRYLWLLVPWWALGRFLQLRLDPFCMEPIFTSPPNLSRLLATAQDDQWFFYALAAFYRPGAGPVPPAGLAACRHRAAAGAARYAGLGRGARQHRH